MKRQLFILAMLVISFAACKKQDSRVTGTTENSKNVAARSAVALPAPANTENPYDSMGYWHNEIVTYIQGCRPEADMPNAMVSAQCVLQFYRERKGEELPLSLFDNVTQTVEKSNEDIDGLIAACPYDDPVKEALHLLIQLLKRLSDEDGDYHVIKSSIVDFERTVSQDNRLTDEGRAVILKTTSVARYSIYYWINYNKPPETAGLRIKNIVKWIAAVTSDIGGAIVSGSAGYAADCSSYAYDLVVYSMP